MSDGEAPALPSDFAGGEPGTGGWFGTWRRRTHDAAVADHIEFQYPGIAHQAETALSGMWLFLVTEALFFAGLFFVYGITRYRFHHAVATGSRETEAWIGTVNTVLLVSSSAVFAWGLGVIRRTGHNRPLFWSMVVVAVLGTAFLGLKVYEWSDDLDRHLMPGPGFAITGADAGGAQLFWCFYWVGTGLHAIHMIVGVFMVSLLAWRARAGRYSVDYHTPVEVVGLYWSFVDMVWLCFYPMLYLVDRTGG